MIMCYQTITLLVHRMAVDVALLGCADSKAIAENAT